MPIYRRLIVFSIARSRLFYIILSDDYLLTMNKRKNLHMDQRYHLLTLIFH
jgi:hypothetical protein